MSDTLVLNADGLPLSVVPLSTLTWQESIKLMFLDRIDILAEYSDWAVNSPSTSIAIPSVVLLRDYVKVSRGIKFSRHNVLLRDNFTCQYCEADFRQERHLLTLDHVVPRYHGGKTTWSNVVAACMSCNLEKAHFTNVKPKCGTPKKPSYYELVNKVKSMPITVPHQSWVDFLGWPPDLIRVKPKKPYVCEFIE